MKSNFQNQCILLFVDVPVFRVRTATAPTSTTVMNKSIKTDAKPISVTTATSMCYEPKQPQNTPTASGSVSVLACFKTTKKRIKVGIIFAFINFDYPPINSSLFSSTV
jgi:hypothetical protein